MDTGGSISGTDYTQLDDAALTELAVSDSLALDFLLDKYKTLVRTRARSYFLIGADREDLIQEGMIGLYKAIRDYNGEKQMSFRSFAELCITRQMITAIKTATRQKHQPLNTYVSINKTAYDEEGERTLMDLVLIAGELNPEDIMIDRESREHIEKLIASLMSDYEKEVIELYITGRSYQQIAQKLGKTPKSIDNALQRIKTKLEKSLREQKQG